MGVSVTAEMMATATYRADTIHPEPRMLVLPPASTLGPDEIRRIRESWERLWSNECLDARERALRLEMK